ncbi:MAG: sulfite exporter TauE/SafE family protein [Verrucomicrobia bacterium]|nr:sulfite exporter TauE/SafE family protein [Verrucomicrobiota bacterium]
MKSLLVVILIGVAAGVVGALCGVGGGIVMVPAFVTVLGFDQKSAVATSMAVIVAIAASATLSNHRAGGLIAWKVVLMVGCASAIAAWFGSDVMRSMSNHTLTRIFGIVLLVFGIRMLWKG